MHFKGWFEAVGSHRTLRTGIEGMFPMKIVSYDTSKALGAFLQTAVILPNYSRETSSGGKRYVTFNGEQATIRIPVNVENSTVISWLTRDLRQYTAEPPADGSETAPLDKTCRELIELLTQATNLVTKQYSYLYNIAKSSPTEWKTSLMDALGKYDNQPWLVYADFLEERGDQDGEKIRAIVNP